MRRILLAKARPAHPGMLERSLAARGLETLEAPGFGAAATMLGRWETADRDLAGVLLEWPEQGAADSALAAFLGRLSERHLQHLAVVVLAEQAVPEAVAWIKQRQRSALLLAADRNEAGDAMARLLEPRPAESISHIEQLSEHHLRVLFVDDSPTVRVAFRRLLMRYGFIVETASSVPEGLRMARESAFDIAIVDYFMPGQPGTALVASLRRDPRTRHLATAVITGTYSDTVINDSLAAGAVECIFKNEAKDLFLARIASLARGVVDRKSIDQERRRLQGILRSVGDGVYGVDSDGWIQFMNPAARDILGIAPEEELSRVRAHDLFHHRAEDGTRMPRDACFLSQCYRSGNQVTGWQTTFWGATGRLIPVECTVYPLEIEGRRQGSVVAFRDVSARKLLEEELRWQATHDALTRLPNRSHFEEQLEQEVHRLQRSDQVSALLYMDLDRFKYINDTAGHAAGDRLLVEVARRLKSRLRVSDSLARIGGDEYAVILRNVDAESARAAAEQFRFALQDLPFIYGDKQYVVSATIGVALIDAGIASPGEAMANADIACHLAKMSGRDRVHLFSSDSDQKAAMDLELGWSSRLRTALREDHFELRFQPILATKLIDMDRLPAEDGLLWMQAGGDAADGPPKDFEVLLRLRDPEGTLIAPDAFLATAERFNMMLEIDRWVIREAFSSLARAVAQGRNIRYAINLSEASILEPDTAAFIAAQLEEKELAGDRVAFELNETRAMTNVEATGALVERLREMGVRFGLDDFGTGFASFSHLRELDVDYLKIDGTYMRAMHEDPINSAVLGAIARIATALGKRTIAECVESSGAVRSLRDSGIDQLQGYFIGRPQAESPEQMDFLDDPKVTSIHRH